MSSPPQPRWISVVIFLAAPGAPSRLGFGSWWLRAQHVAWNRSGRMGLSNDLRDQNISPPVRCFCNYDAYHDISAVLQTTARRCQKYFYVFETWWIVEIMGNPSISSKSRPLNFNMHCTASREARRPILKLLRHRKRWTHPSSISENNITFQAIPTSHFPTPETTGNQSPIRAFPRGHSFMGSAVGGLLTAAAYGYWCGLRHRFRVVRWKSRSKPDWFSVRNLTLQAYAIAGHYHSTSAPRRECDGGWVEKKSSTTFPKKNAKKREPEPSTKTVKHPQTGGAVKEGPRLNEIHRNSDCENQENPLLWLRLASIRRIILEVSSIRGTPKSSIDRWDFPL